MRGKQQQQQGRLQKCLGIVAPLWFPFLRLVVTFVVVGLIGLFGVLAVNSPGVSTKTTGKFNLSGRFSPRDSNLTAFDGTGAAQARVLFNSHSHTTRSDGAMTPAEIVEWHVAYGYDAFAVTDHNTPSGATEVRDYARRHYNDTVVVVPGFEWTTTRFHFTVLGIDERIDLYSTPTDQQVKDVVGTIHAKGGLIGLNHRQWSQESKLEVPTFEQLEAFGVDFVEVVNDFQFDMQALMAVTQGKTKLGILAGTDTHYGSVRPFCWMTLNPSVFTEAAILEELRAHRTSFIYQAIDVPILSANSTQANPWYTILYVWLNFGWFFSRYYEAVGTRVVLKWPIILTSVAWIFFTWLAAEVMAVLIGSACRRSKDYFDRTKSARYAAFVHPVSSLVDEFGSDEGADTELDMLTTGRPKKR